VGTPYPNGYTDPRTLGRQSLDDDHYESKGFPFFTRYALSISVKASENFAGNGWKKAYFNIEICLDTNRAGAFGLVSHNACCLT
jgi:hypothetical protein